VSTGSRTFTALTSRSFTTLRWMREIDPYASFGVVETGHSPPIPARLTDTRMYLKVIKPRLKCEMAPGDIVPAGIVVSNSEVRQGALSVQPRLYRLVFRNGLIALDRSLRKTHVGRALGTDEDAIRRGGPSSLRSVATRAWKGASRGVCAAVTGASRCRRGGRPICAEARQAPGGSNRWCVFMSIGPSTRPSRRAGAAPQS